MKVRTINELQTKLDFDISWRKKELIDYRFVVEKNKSSTQIIPLVRGGIALGYAHWEGFIKTSSAIYISYITTKKIPNERLKSNFIALSYLRKLNRGKSIQECINLIDEILFNATKPCKILDKDVIDTKSNLKYVVLKEILDSLGLDESFFSSKENFLDKKLVEPRNDIAHGTYRDLTFEDYKIVYDNIIPLMEHYKTLIENSVALRQYIR